MSRRLRVASYVIQAVFIVTVISLLIFSIVQTNQLARDRAKAALALSRQNNTLLHRIDDLVGDVRGAQVNQRNAFRRLARRNETLHGSDPSNAPVFTPLAPSSSNPTPSAGEGGSNGDPGSGDRGQPRDRSGRQTGNGDRDPKPRPTPSPTPTPDPEPTCLPIIDLCIGSKG